MPGRHRFIRCILSFHRVQRGTKGQASRLIYTVDQAYRLSVALTPHRAARADDALCVFSVNRSDHQW